MSVRVDSKQIYDYDLYDLRFFYTIALHNTKLKKKKINENESTAGLYLRFIYSDKGNVIVKYISIKQIFQ